MSSTEGIPSFADVVAAADRIAPFVEHTPVLTSSALDELVGARVHLKAEHVQRGGAFKFRGAMNAIQALDDAVAARGVAGHSSGNHGATLALAASIREISCHVVMPADAPRVKVEAARAAGATVTLCEPILSARAEVLAEILTKSGATEIHPYDDPDVIAGQGTAVLELLEIVPELRLVVAPVSGGGLLSGAAIAAHGIDPAIAVWGAEPAAVDDAARSLAAGHLVVDGNTTSIADGLLTVLSERTFAILQDHDVRIVTVSEQEILDAMRFLHDVLDAVVEPSGATGLAGLLALARAGSMLPDDVGVILSGGNLDRDRFGI